MVKKSKTVSPTTAKGASAVSLCDSCRRPCKNKTIRPVSCPKYSKI